MMDIEGGLRRFILPVPEDGVVLIEFLLENEVEMLVIQVHGSSFLRLLLLSIRMLQYSVQKCAILQHWLNACLFDLLQIHLYCQAKSC